MFGQVRKFLKNISGMIEADHMVLMAGIVGMAIGASVVFSNAVKATAEEIHNGLHNVGMPYVFHSDEDTHDDNGEFVESEENGVITNRYDRK